MNQVRNNREMEKWRFLFQAPLLFILTALMGCEGLEDSALL